MITQPIRISCESTSPRDLKAELQAEIVDDIVQFRLEQHRQIEVEVLLALTGLAGTGLVTLINGALRIAANKKLRSIKIRTANGRELQIPADLSDDEIDQWIERSKSLENVVEIEIL